MKKLLAFTLILLATGMCFCEAKNARPLSNNNNYYYGGKVNDSTFNFFFEFYATCTLADFALSGFDDSCHLVNGMSVYLRWAQIPKLNLSIQSSYSNSKSGLYSFHGEFKIFEDWQISYYHLEIASINVGSDTDGLNFYIGLGLGISWEVHEVRYGLSANDVQETACSKLSFFFHVPHLEYCLNDSWKLWICNDIDFVPDNLQLRNYIKIGLGKRF